MTMAILDVRAAGLRFDVTLNGLPVMSHSADPPYAGAAKLDGWAVSGANTLALSIARIGSGGKEPACSLTVRLAEPGPDTSRDRTVLDYHWPSGVISPTMTRVLEREIDLGPRPRWAWQDATPRPSLNDADRAALTDLVRQLEGALHRRAAADLQQLQSLSLREQAEASGLSPAEVQGSYARFLARLFADSGYAVTASRPEELVFDVRAEGKVVRITTLDGTPPVRAGGTGQSFAIDPVVALIAGRWTIVR
jgi:hypothetical protein